MNGFYINFGISGYTAAHMFSDDTKKRKATKPGNSFWYNIKKLRGYTKISPTSKVAVDEWIIKHSYIIVSPIKMNILI